MHNFSSILRKSAVRLLLSAAFTLLWRGIYDVPTAAPLVFCGCVCLAGAWLTYLRLDGLSLFRMKGFSFRSRRAERAARAIEIKSDEEMPADESRLNIKASLLAGALLICASFIF